MKYDINDTVSYGNPGYEHECIIVKARPPQPTYSLKDNETGVVYVEIEEDKFELVKKACQHRRSAYIVVPTSQGNKDTFEYFDFCPNCGTDLKKK